jgi:LPS-assembly lipoprotein
MPGRRAFLALGAVVALGLPGCGWTPLYADSRSGPASEDLRAIRVAPIPERIGQRLEMALRNSLNPSGEPTKERYVLHTTLAVSLVDVGIQSQGTATLGRLDVFATYSLADSRGGSALLTNSLHVQNSFALDPNQYSTVVAEDDSGVRAVAELNQEIVARLTLFMEHRAAENTPKQG